MGYTFSISIFFRSPVELRCMPLTELVEDGAAYYI